MENFIALNVWKYDFSLRQMALLYKLSSAVIMGRQVLGLSQVWTFVMLNNVKYFLHY